MSSFAYDTTVFYLLIHHATYIAQERSSLRVEFTYVLFYLRFQDT